VFFDGIRLGLEGSMLVVLGIGIPSGLHIALSAILGYAVRLSDGFPAQANQFAPGGFLFVAVLATIAMAMVMFFLLAVPTMAYSMVLVAAMLRWVGKRWPRQKLASTIAGAAMGLVVGIAGSAVVFAIVGIAPSFSVYTQAFRWPAILTIDGIVLLWFSVSPLVSAGAGAQVGRRLGKQLEAISQYWYW
jgi:cellulose synthase/poly-beta-1,6-N-acetylglucosamine synthase-like glycosyltransferase